MDARRRTLASEGPLGNALPASSLPVPSSAMKKAPTRLGSSRMSMIPTSSQQNLREAAAKQGQGMRVSSNGSNGYGNGLGSSSSQDAGGARRSTTVRPTGADVGRMSAPRGDGGIYGRTPQVARNLPSRLASKPAPVSGKLTRSTRRSSVFPGPRPSIAPTSYPSEAVKDPRPIRDKTFLANCQKNIHEYLVTSRCPVPLTSKTLVSPTTKDFQAIFRFLVSELLDPGMVWGKRFEDDCIMVLKDLRYPSMDTVGKTALVTAGDPQQWPKLLAMLNWMVDLCKAHDNWCEPEVISDPLLIPAKDLPLDHPNLTERLLWDFSSKTYQQWFDGGAEVFPEAEQELEEVFDKLAQATFEECEKMDTEIQKRTAELHQLEAQQPPLKKADDEYVQLMDDKTKFIQYIDWHRTKAEKTRVQNAKIRAALADHDEQIKNVRAELAQIETAVAAQNLSPEEVTRMNDARETLQHQLADLRTKINSATSESYDHELQVTRAMDRFEQLLSEYTVQAHQIGLMRPLTSDGSAMPASALGPDGVDYALDLDLRLEDVGEIQGAAKRMRQSIRPALHVMADGVRKESERLAHSQIALEDEYDRLAQAVERQREEAKTLEMRLKVVSDQAESEKSKLQADTAETNNTVAKLETEVVAVSAASEQGVVNAQGELDRKRIEYDQLREKTQTLQDAVTAQMMHHIGVIIKAKEHTANSLKSVRTFAEGQQ